MEQQTKNCPYCGEVIMAVAKKCKHCGEWLDQKEKQADITETTELESETEKQQDAESDEQQDVPAVKVIPIFSKIFFWVTIVGMFISTVHEIDFGRNVRGPGKYRALIEIANMIPEEVAACLECLGFLGMIFLLMRLTKILGKPMNVLCSFAMVVYALLLPFEFIEIDILFILLFLGMLTIAYALFLIIGIRLTNHKNSLRALGISMIIWSAVSIINFFISLFLESFEIGVSHWVYTISDLAFYLVLRKSLMEACDHPQKANGSKMWILNIIAFVVGLIIAVACQR